jgi:hypothetical protein
MPEINGQTQTDEAKRAELARRIDGRSRLTREFRLRSGAVSDEYFDKYLFESDPLLLHDIAEALLSQLPADVDALAGLELGGVPLATVASQVSGLPTLFVAAGSSLVDLIEAVRALPYGRPSDCTAEGMLRERRGTCSTKHLFLAQALEERFPETEPLIVHRAYILDRARAREMFGATVAGVVPEDGLVDVHRYLTITLEGQHIEIDATFPGPAWDGRSSLPLACGSGHDFPAGEDPDAEKRALEAQHCDRAIRESFIAALASACVELDV